MSLCGLLMAGRMMNHGSGDYVTRSEYMMTENKRIISFVFLVASMVLGCIGCKTLKAVNKANPEFANVVFRKNLFRVAFVMALCLIAHHFKRETHSLMRNKNPNFGHHEPEPIDMEDMPTIDEAPKSISEDSEESQDEDLTPEDFDYELLEKNYGRHLEEAEKSVTPDKTERKSKDDNTVTTQDDSNKNVKEE